MALTADNATAVAGATRVRYGVLALTSALAMITYLDRACMGSAKPWLVESLGLSGPGDLGWVFSAFGLAYAIFEIPSGWLGDTFGPRSVLIRIVLWWSAFTALTAIVGIKVGGIALGGLGTLVAVRFLFGMGEAGAFPNITRALHNWFPFAQRGFTQGTVWMSGRLMGGLTPVIWALLVPALEKADAVPLGSVRWRMAFWIFAAVGVAWCIVFAVWFRNRPEEKAGVNTAELALIRQGRDGHAAAAHAGVPWGRILRSRSLWCLCTMYFCQSYGWYFYMTFLPGYLNEHYGVEKQSLLGALAEGGPLWIGAVGCLAGGLLTDWFIRRTGNRRLGRTLFGVIGHGLTAVCFFLCPLMPGPVSFFVVISLSGFFTDLTMGSSWAACQDIGRRYAAVVAGTMNMVGNLGGALGPGVTGYILSRALLHRAASRGLSDPRLLPHADWVAAGATGAWANFMIFGAVFVLGALCWLAVDPTQAVAEE